MLIGIDGNEANFEKKVGVHKQAYEIVWGLYKLEDKKKSPNNYLIFLKNPPRDDMPKENSFWKYRLLQGNGLWVLTRLMPFLWKHPRCDVFLTPSHYVPPLTPMPKVCIITDLGYLKFSAQFTKYDFWQLKYWTAISIIVSKHIIAISESCRADIVRHYSFASKKVKTVYLAGDLTRKDSKIPQNFVRQTLAKYRITKEYVVFLSTLKPGKNIEGLIKGFSRLKKAKEYQLVIIGKKGWLYETIFEQVKKLGLGKQVIFTDYVTDAEKAAVFSRAKAFALPSFWEGFGIDVLNAFALGVPVVVSRVASLPEVGGNAAFYVDPYNPKDITEKLEKVLSLRSKEYNNVIERGYKQALKFSWDKTASETLAVLEKTAQKP